MSICEKAKIYGSGDEISDRNEIKVFEEERICCSWEEIKDYRKIKDCAEVKNC